MQKICARTAIGMLVMAVCCQAETSQPNILFIVCDDLNDTVEGMGGHPQALTPNIDRLMQRGVRFLNAGANTPLCSPSRASLWSGLAPQTTGFYGYHQDKVAWRENPVMKDTVTLFEHASHNGYRIFATGKLHHNGEEDWSVFRNSDGTDGFRLKTDWGPYVWDGVSHRADNDRGLVHPSLPEEWQQGDGRFDFPSSFGPITDISDSYNGMARWVYEDRMPFDVRSAYDMDPLPDERYADFAADILRSRQDQPFFLAIGFCRPHVPLHVPQKYFDMFPIEEVQLSPGIGGDPAEVPDCFKIAPGIKRYRKMVDAGGIELFRRWTQAYLASVAFVDEQIGTVLDALESGPHLSNTVVILTSDNGYHMGEKDINSKNSVWEPSMRVPLVIAAPGGGKDRNAVIRCRLWTCIRPAWIMGSFRQTPIRRETACRWMGTAFVRLSKIQIKKAGMVPISRSVVLLLPCRWVRTKPDTARISIGPCGQSGIGMFSDRKERNCSMIIKPIRTNGSTLR
jgi:arylsulfatase A-like enzyme